MHNHAPYVLLAFCSALWPACLDQHTRGCGAYREDGGPWGYPVSAGAIFLPVLVGLLR